MYEIYYVTSVHGYLQVKKPTSHKHNNKRNEMENPNQTNQTTNSTTLLLLVLPTQKGNRLGELRGGAGDRRRGGGRGREIVANHRNHEVFCIQARPHAVHSQQSRS
jgi:hypothetical protein